MSATYTLNGQTYTVSGNSAGTYTLPAGAQWVGGDPNASGGGTTVGQAYGTPTPTGGTVHYDLNGNMIITDEYGHNLNYGNPTLTNAMNEGDIRNKVLTQFQREIDANKTIYAQKLADAKQAGLGRLGSARATQARGGLLGSDFAGAQTDKVNTGNAAIEDSINAELAAKIASIEGTANGQANTEIEAKRKAQQEGLDSYLKYLGDRSTTIKTNLSNLAKDLILKNLTPDQLGADKLASIATSYQTTPADIKAAYDAEKKTSDASKNALALSTEKTKADIAQSNAAVNKDKYISIGDGSILYNTETGKSIENTKNFAPGSGGGAPTNITPGSPLYKVAQDLAYGGLTFSQFKSLYSYSRNVADKIGIYNLAGELNPKFNAADFEAGYKFYTNPKTRGQLSAADNALSNIDKVIAISNEASRTGVTALNKIVNKAGYELGGKKYANFRQAQELLADEVSGVLGYGTGTDMKLKLGLDILDPNLPPDVFASNLEQLKHFLENKKQSILDYTSVYGQGQQNGEKIRVKINSTGQTGTIDAAEFDPATMSKL